VRRPRSCFSRHSDIAAVAESADWQRLLLPVHLNSERTVEPVRQDGSFAEKQQSHRALLFLVPSGRLAGINRDARSLCGASGILVVTRAGTQSRGEAARALGDAACTRLFGLSRSLLIHWMATSTTVSLPLATSSGRSDTAHAAQLGLVGVLSEGLGRKAAKTLTDEEGRLFEVSKPRRTS
jgi:hypothetical protein